MGGFKERLRKMDSHSSVSKEFRVYTAQGATLSVVTCVVIMYLMWKEMNYNFESVLTERVHVNATSPRGLDVEFDISFPDVSCDLLNIDANDPSGQSQSLHLDQRHHVWKHRIKVNQENGHIQFIGDRRKLEQGSTLIHEDHLEDELDRLEDLMPENDQFIKDDDENDDDTDTCGSCYGAGEEGECCNTCDDVKRAYKVKGWHLQNPMDIKQCQEENALKAKIDRENEGCNVHGLIALDSGGGNFHLAPGKDRSDMDMHDIQSIFDMLLR